MNETKIMLKIGNRLVISIILAGTLILLLFAGVLHNPISSLLKETGDYSNAVSSANLTGNFNYSPPDWNNDFLIGAMNDGMEWYYDTLRDKLGFNLWHFYGLGDGYDNGRFWVKGWSLHDSLDTPVGRYGNEVQGVLERINSYGMKTLMERPKIKRLAYAQRSDYQCEEEQDLTNHDYWFYTFQVHETGSDKPDSGAIVRFCNASGHGGSRDNPGFVCKRLRANNEQCNMSYGALQGDGYCSWIIKPRVRVDPAFVDNPANQNADICRIDVYNFNGSLIKSTVIKAKHFKDQNGVYKGEYKEEYSFGSSESNLTFPETSAMDFNPQKKFWAFTSRGNFLTDADTTCKADIQVYWYGSCDTWIDYVRVDNDVADRLFKGQYDEWIRTEAQNIGGFNSLPTQWKFYIEEFEFNNIPCMAYVSHKLSDYSNGRFTLMCDLNYTTYNAHLPFVNGYPQLSFEHVKRCLLDSIGSTELFAGSYALLGRDNFGLQAGEDSRIPNSLPKHDYSIREGRLAYDVVPGNYDDWLQRLFDTSWVPFHKGEFTYYMKNYDSLSKQKNIPFINLEQAHLWYTSGEKRREPTDEELEMMADLAITYGARGNLYFYYGAFNDPANNSYGYGLLSNEHPITPRFENAYGQPKWNKVKEIDAKLKKWGPFLMSFDNTNRHSYIYRLDYSGVNNSTIFSDIQTYPPNPNDYNNPGSNPENYPNRYIQAATFKAENDNTNKYFMLVNRRCSPFYARGIDPRFPNGENGGRRYMKVSFNASNLQNSSTWKITNLEDGTEVARFNTSGNPIVNLGWFMPGEGKLYKLEPTQ